MHLSATLVAKGRHGRRDYGRNARMDEIVRRPCSSAVAAQSCVADDIGMIHAVLHAAETAIEADQGRRHVVRCTRLHGEGNLAQGVHRTLIVTFPIRRLGETTVATVTTIETGRGTGIEIGSERATGTETGRGTATGTSIATDGDGTPMTSRKLTLIGMYQVGADLTAIEGEVQESERGPGVVTGIDSRVKV